MAPADALMAHVALAILSASVHEPVHGADSGRKPEQLVRRALAAYAPPVGGGSSAVRALLLAPVSPRPLGICHRPPISRRVGAGSFGDTAVDVFP